MHIFMQIKSQKMKSQHMKLRKYSDGDRNKFTSKIKHSKQSQNIQSNHQTSQLSTTKLYILFGIIAVVWLLCYISQAKIVHVQVQQLIGRLQDRNISDSQLTHAVEAYYRGQSSYRNQDHLLKQKQKFENVQSKTFNSTNISKLKYCVLVNHKMSNQNWVGSLMSIISQTQTQTKIFYINNHRGTEELQKYLESNAILSYLLNLQSIQQMTNFNFESLIKLGQKCIGYDYIVVMDDDLVLADQFVFQDISQFVENEGGAKEVQLLYGGMGTRGNSFNQLQLGKSFPYPPNILQTRNFTNYPFVINGILFFTPSLHKKLTYNLTKNSKGQAFFRALKPSILLEMLNKAEGKIHYMNKVLVFTDHNSDQQYVAPEAGLKIQLKELYMMK